jgi:hypothetical protein
MAFLEPIRLSAVDRTHPTDFSALEWRIIGLARTDGLGSLRVPGLLARVWSRITGVRRDPRLADGRLEALRRLAVDAWHRGYNVRPSILAAFRAAGFTDGQFETLLAAVHIGRRAPQSWSIA